MINSEVRRFKRYRADPIAFMVDVLGVDPALVWSSMYDMTASIRDNRYTAIAGCHSSSKTYTVAALVWWWVLCWQPAIVYITAPRKETVTGVFWKQLGQHYEAAPQPLGGELQMSSWKYTKDTYIVGTTARKDTGASGSTGMQGHKSLRLMAIFEEATGIERHFFESAKGILTFPDNRWVCLGNPTNPNCGFRDLWRSPSWNCINIDAMRNPNLEKAFLDWPNRRVIGGNTSHPYLLQPDFVEELMEWGDGSPPWESRVRGRFPTAAIDTLISLADFEDARHREPQETIDPLTYIGCDVAAEGDDKSVIVVIRGDYLVHVEAFHEPDVTITGDRVIETSLMWGVGKGRAHQISVDKGGLGVGCYNHIRRQGWMIQGEDFGRKAHRPDLYHLRRTELWVGVRDWLRGPGSLKNVRQDWLVALEGDLCGCRVDPFKQIAEHTVLSLEPKKKMKERIGRSPDYGDALAICLGHTTAHNRLFAPQKKKPELLSVGADDIRWQSYQDDKKNRAARRSPRKDDFYG